MHTLKLSFIHPRFTNVVHQHLSIVYDRHTFRFNESLVNTVRQDRINLALLKNLFFFLLQSLLRNPVAFLISCRIITLGILIFGVEFW